MPIAPALLRDRRSAGSATSALTTALVVLALAGCRSGGSLEGGDSGPFGALPSPLNWGADENAHRSGVPQRIVATWVDTVRQQQGEAAERGFGGRVYFYDRGPDPITVEGRLVVYAFDERGRVPTDHKPTRRYVFPAEELSTRMSASEIGPSYSVWLPWDRADGPSTEVSLIARFEPTQGGGLVVSDQVRQRLPGRESLAPGSPTEALAERAGSGRAVQQAAYTDRTAGAGATDLPGPVEPAEPKRRLSTTTIRLNR